jgi:hypothetical protein
VIDPNARIEGRLHRARLSLRQALVDLNRAAKRVAKHTARISRLETSLRTPAEVRRERARKATATRKAPKRRAIEMGGGQ